MIQKEVETLLLDVKSGKAEEEEEKVEENILQIWIDINCRGAVRFQSVDVT